SVNPSSGPSGGGTVVTIAGQGFEPGATAFFGGSPANATYLSPVQLRAMSPSHPAGSVDLTVVNPSGQAATLSMAFTFEGCAPPSIIVPPMSAMIHSGESATLTVQASLASTFQWYLGRAGDTAVPISNGSAASIVVSPTR